MSSFRQTGLEHDPIQFFWLDELKETSQLSIRRSPSVVLILIDAPFAPTPWSSSIVAKLAATGVEIF
jgi:hypothetical protein